MSEQPQLITIDNQKYDLSELSEEARTQLLNIQVTEEHIRNLGNQLAITQSGRNSYAEVLKQRLPEKEAPSGTESDVVTIDERRYLLEDFSEEGRQQLLNLRTADAELKRLKDQEAIAHTARESYGRALAEAIKSARPVTVQ